MSKQRFALLIAIALCVGASAGAYKPQCKDSSGRLIVCAGTLDNTQAPTAPAMSGANITAGTVPNASLASSSLTVTAGTGLSGGGAVSLGGSTSLSIASTAVAAGSYPTTGRIPTFTVGADGRLTAAGSTTDGSALTSLNGANITDATVANTKITGAQLGRVLADNGTNGQWVPPGTLNYLFFSNGGTSLPAWTNTLVGINIDGATNTITNITTSALASGFNLAANQGGTGFTTYTVGDVLAANTTSTLSKVAAGTSGHVLTANGAGVLPSYQAPVTGTAAQAVLGVTQFDITSTSYAATGLSIPLPSAGTYEVWAEMRQGVQVSASPNGAISTEFYNVTDGAVIANSERLGVVATQNNLAATTTIRMSARITVNGAKTIEVYALRESGPSYTFSYFYSDGKGRTVIGYEKKA